MKFSEIKPFVRYARTLSLDGGAVPEWRTAYDARLFYVLDGEGSIALRDRTLPLERGSAALIAAGIPYAIRVGQTEKMTCLAFNFDYTSEHSHLRLPIVPAGEGRFCPSLMHEQAVFEDEAQLNGYLLIPDAEAIERRCRG